MRHYAQRHYAQLSQNQNLVLIPSIRTASPSPDTPKPPGEREAEATTPSAYSARGSFIGRSRWLGLRQRFIMSLMLAPSSRSSKSLGTQKRCCPSYFLQAWIWASTSQTVRRQWCGCETLSALKQ